jgi:probable rRNA maturation factor
VSTQTVSIQNTTKGRLPSLPFVQMKNEILGTGYELSVVFVGEQKIRTLNRTYREKDKPTDILSFPLTETSGEIFICITQARKKAPAHSRTPQNYLAFLFIHGLLHLKGLDHGSRMENKFASLFNI